jgi:hypothetical protein
VREIYIERERKCAIKTTNGHNHQLQKIIKYKNKEKRLVNGRFTIGSKRKWMDEKQNSKII